MSVPPSSSRISNGRNHRLYWCYQCHQTVRVAAHNPSNIICPQCLGEFLYEVDVERPGHVHDITAFDASPQARILEIFFLLLDPTSRSHAPALDGRERRFLPRRLTNVFEDQTDAWSPGSGIVARPRSWTTFRPAGNYFFSPGLHGIIEELTQNDRSGPPPAPDSAINAIPTCKHIYHLNCIVPWLRLHNSCPVCRQEIPPTCDVPVDHAGEENTSGRTSLLRQLMEQRPSRSRYRRHYPRNF